MDIKNLPASELIALKKYFESKYQKLDPRYWDREKRAMEIVKKIETILDKIGEKIMTNI
jgi:hypothetical protein